MADLDIKVDEEEDVVCLKLSGSINENANFDSLDLSPGKKLIIDIENVRLINSTGLRNWVIWVKSLDPNTQILLRHCPHVVVEQMNILKSFLPSGAIVESFEVPYHCESCGYEEMVMAERGVDYMEGTADQKEGILLPEQRPCPECEEKMGLDVLPAKYFTFLKFRR